MRYGLFLMLLAGIIVMNGCYMVSQSTEYYGMQVEGKKVVFLLDISGSMEGKDEGSLKDQAIRKGVNTAANAARKTVGGKVGRWISAQLKSEATKLGSAKRELIPVIRGLAPDSQFTIIMFGGRITPWRPNLVEANTTNKNMATYDIKALSAGGGTPAFSALKQAFNFPGIDTIYFLSDGCPTDANVQRILKEIARLNRRRAVTINTIGLGDDQNKDFLCNLASQNHGVYAIESHIECSAIK